MSLAEAFWMAKPCWKGCRKSGPRDKVVVEGGEVRYFLWGSQIVTWNKKENTLRVDDCHWKTTLTFKRLNSILSKLPIFIRSIHGVTCLVDSTTGTEYVWEGVHLIHLETHAVHPGILRKTNPKVSQALQKYYTTATELMSKHRQLVAQTLTDEVVCLIPKLYSNGQFQLSLLGLYVNGDAFRGYVGKVACSKVYSAFMKNTTQSLADHLTMKGEELYGQEILSAISEFRVETTCLPPKVVRQLALLKLVEA
ncbi:MAG: hypothetical protein LBI79_03635 [Nitrososphaerota archaeon]|nr:hypothetical protein [Nitrososphaerota archaeon]